MSKTRTDSPTFVRVEFTLDERPTLSLPVTIHLCKTMIHTAGLSPVRVECGVLTYERLIREVIPQQRYIVHRSKENPVQNLRYSELPVDDILLPIYVMYGTTHTMMFAMEGVARA